MGKGREEKPGRELCDDLTHFPCFVYVVLRYCFARPLKRLRVCGSAPEKEQPLDNDAML
jgi:hypothetical protein